MALPRIVVCRAQGLPRKILLAGFFAKKILTCLRRGWAGRLEAGQDFFAGPAGRGRNPVSLRVAADKLRGETQKYFNGVKNLSELDKLQRYVVMRLSSLHALRLDWADVKLGKPGKEQVNYLYKDSRKGWQLIMRKYKTAKVMGQQNIKLSRAASLVLTMFVPIVKAKTEHGYLLSTKGGKKLSRKGLSNLLSRTTEKYIGKRISAQIIRVLKATKFKKQTEEAADLAKEMLHGKDQHLQYTKKDKK